MSSRPFVKKFAAIVDGDMSQAAITSAVTVLTQLSIVSYSYSWAGSSPLGIVEVQVSNDYSENLDGSAKNAGTWITLYFTLNGSSTVSSAPVSGNTGKGMIEFSTAAYAVRTVYTKTSGTGTLQSAINCKVA